MKTKTQKLEFKFWKGNKLSNEFTLSLEELKNQYREWLKTKDIDWIEYYGHQTVSAFIISADGLGSSFEHGDMDLIQSELMEVRHELYP